MNKILNTTLAAILFCTAASADNSTKTYTVTVAYDGTKAVVSIPEAITDYVSCPSGESSHVKLLQTSTTEKNPGEIIYSLSGQSDNGEFYLTGEYKATLQLNGLTLANPGVADSTSKGCFHCKGHTEFAGKGTLNVSSSFSHAIYSKEYVEVKNCTLNITSAKKDGIHCQEYFLMNSGTLTIKGAEDDAIQVELKDSVATGQTKDHEDENSGNFYMNGGTLTISEIGGYCVKADGSIMFSSGTRNFDTNNIKDHATTGINPVVSRHSGNRQYYYDLNGRCMPNEAVLPRGIYIVKEGDKARKIVVK